MRVEYSPEKIRMKTLIRGLSDYDLSNRTKITPQTFWNLRKGKVQKVDENTLALLAKALGCSVEELQ